MANKIGKETQRVAKLLYKGQIKPGTVDNQTIRLMAQELMQAVLSGSQSMYGFKEASLTNGEYELLSKLEDNVHVFSGFKNYRQLQEVSALLVKNGKQQPFYKFLEAVRKIDATYNEHYLKAEYNLARTSAQQAEEWRRIQEDKDLFPYLEYVAVLDGHQTPLCDRLDGKVIPVNDPFWQIYFPPNHWRCRSYAKPVSQPGEGDKTIVRPDDLPNMPEMFRNNVGITGEAFPDTHPYFKMKANEAAKVRDALGVLIPARWENYKQYQVLKNLDYITGTSFKKESGGFYAQHIKHGVKELGQNKKIGMQLRDDGFGVTLLEDVANTKSADAELHGLGEWEFKTLANFTNPSRAIQAQLRAAKKQAGNIVVYTEKDLTAHHIAMGLWNAVKYDKKGQIKKVMIKKKSLKPIIVTRAEIESGRAEQILNDWIK